MTKDTLLGIAINVIFVLSIFTIRYKYANIKQKISNQFNNFLEYEKKIDKYLFIYYTILEIGVKDIYINWIKKFIIQFDIIWFYIIFLKLLLCFSN